MLGIQAFQSCPVSFQLSNEGRHRSNGGGCIVQGMKHKWGKHETRRPKGKKKNGERPSMKRGNSKWGGEMGTAGKLLMEEKRNGEKETNQICNEYRPGMEWQQAKHAMETGQAYNDNRPSIF
ncbi:hypothetical protein TNCV_4078551 [Trichonephila clavipes]|nr:hypothetical protein TNCV_4078551 [Trichonephila clavipes]